MKNPNPRFTGLFIPVEILDLDLTSTEYMLLAWIDSLYSEDHGGCFASNEYFCEKLHLKENTIKILISKLVDMGLVERVSFDGRQRVIRACKEKWFEKKNKITPQKSQSTAEVDLNQPQTLKIINPCGLLESTPHVIYREKTREKNKYLAQSTSSLRKKASQILFSFEERKFHNIQEIDMSQWKEVYSAIDINLEIKKMIEWCLSNPKKAGSKKLWRKFITSWLSSANEKSINQQAYRSNNSNKPNNQSDANIQENKKLCDKFQAEYKSTQWRIDSLSKHVELVPIGCQGSVEILKFTDFGFKEQFESMLRKKGFFKKRD